MQTTIFTTGLFGSTVGWPYPLPSSHVQTCHSVGPLKLKQPSEVKEMPVHHSVPGVILVRRWMPLIGQIQVSWTGPKTTSLCICLLPPDSCWSIGWSQHHHQPCFCLSQAAQDVSQLKPIVTSTMLPNWSMDNHPGYTVHSVLDVCCRIVVSSTLLIGEGMALENASEYSAPSSLSPHLHQAHLVLFWQHIFNSI